MNVLEDTSRSLHMPLSCPFPLVNTYLKMRHTAALIKGASTVVPGPRLRIFSLNREFYCCLIYIIIPPVRDWALGLGDRGERGLQVVRSLRVRTKIAAIL